ncbi:MAG: hypothetical protein ACFFEV_08120, partial [Candidatus Thorarchaeota archaeon]
MGDNQNPKRSVSEVITLILRNSLDEGKWFCEILFFVAVLPFLIIIIANSIKANESPELVVGMILLLSGFVVAIMVPVLLCFGITKSSKKPSIQHHYVHDEFGWKNWQTVDFPTSC